MKLSARLQKFSLLGIPFLVILLAIFAKQATGPYWLGTNFDPSYIYLMNSLYLLDGITPIFVDHPGTTLQVLSALVIKGLTLGVPQQEVASRVFDNPEYYQEAIYGVLFVIYIVSLAAVGFYSFRKTKNLLFSLFLQMPALLYFTLKSYSSIDVLPVIANINAETLVISVTNLYLMCILKLYYIPGAPAGTGKGRDYLLSAFLFGVVCAAGCVTKVSFFPMLLLPLVLLPKVRAKALFVFSFVSFWFLLTLPIASRYGKMYAWLKGIVTHTEFHGAGREGFIDLPVYLGSIGWVLKENLFYSFIVLCCVGVVAYSMFWWKKQQAEEKKRNGLLLTLILVLGLHVLMVAKQPSPQYLAPAVGLFGIMLALLVEAIQNRFAFKKRYVVFGFVVLLGIYTFAAVHYLTKVYKRNHEIWEFSKKISEKYSDCVISGYYRASSVLVAMDFGDDCSGFRAYGETLQKKFPQAVFWNRWTRYFHNFTRDIPLQELLAKNKCVLLYGEPMSFPGYIKVEKIESNRWENLYKITATTGTEAAFCYVAAKNSEARGDYKAALVAALQAKQFGFPNIDKYIAQLEGLINKKK